MYAILLLIAFSYRVCSGLDGFDSNCLKSHNQYRSKHGSPPFVWSESLAAQAQKWADHLAKTDTFEHDYESIKKFHQGENLAYFTPPRSKCMSDKGEDCVQCSEMVADWYNEVDNYDFDSTKSSNGKPILHFTQVVWKETTELGVGTAISNGQFGFITVARYSPRGNFGYPADYRKNVLPAGTPPPALPPKTPESPSPTRYPSTSPPRSSSTSQSTNAAGSTKPTQATTKETTSSNTGPTSQEEECEFFIITTVTKEKKIIQKCKGKPNATYVLERSTEKPITQHYTVHQTTPSTTPSTTKTSPASTTKSYTTTTSTTTTTAAPVSTTETYTTTTTTTAPESTTESYTTTTTNTAPPTSSVITTTATTTSTVPTTSTSAPATNEQPTTVGPTAAPSTTAASTGATTTAIESTASSPTTKISSAAPPTTGVVASKATPSSGSLTTVSSAPSIPPSPVATPGTAPLEEGALQEQEKKAVVLINLYRAFHGAHPLVPNKEMTQEAQSWAEHLAETGQLSHDTSTKDGENIAKLKGRSKDVENAIHFWYNEEKAYDFVKREFSKETGHFTQLVWKSSHEVGIGIAPSKDNSYYYIVARFRPSGNIKGRFPENVDPETTIKL